MARWGRASKAVAHALLIWLVATLTLGVLALLMPDFRLGDEDGRGPVALLVAAGSATAAFGALSALIWPWLVRAMLLVPSLVLALLVFVLNGALVLLALQLVPSDYGSLDLPAAVMVAAVLSTATSVAHSALAVRDDEAYRRRLARMAGRRVRLRQHYPDGTEPPPGLVFLQLDGLGHDVAQLALRTGYLPTLARWLASGSHRLVPWRTDWSSQTGSSQLAILHGSNFDVPAFRWYEKDSRHLMVCNRPATAAELERRQAERPGLLAGGGASRGNLFTGGAAHSALVLSVSGRPGRRDRTGYFAYFSDPACTTRTVFSFIAEVVRELVSSARQRWRDERPRVRRGGLYPLVRAFATVVERDVVATAVMGDMLAGRPVVYADLIGYDEVAHHSGVRDKDTLRVLRRLDRRVAMIADVAPYAPRRYELVLLSDHGQTPSEPFAARFGQTLPELVRGGSHRSFDDPTVDTGRGAEARAAARLALAGPEFDPDGHTRAAVRSPFAGPEPGGGAQARAAARLGFAGADPGRADDERVHHNEPIVLASGNVGLVSFPDVPNRMTAAEIERRHPGLLDRLARHPGIGFVLVRDGDRGPLAIGADGVHELATGRVDGVDPLTVFGPGAADTVRRTDSFPHCPDIVINSSYSPASDRVYSFEEQIGAHGGLGGGQSRSFLLYPAHLPAPAEPLVGAESLHRLFTGWLSRLRLPDGEDQRAAEAGRRR